MRTLAHALACFLAGVVLPGLGTSTGAKAASSSPPPLDYAQARHWVCRPGLAACHDDMSATVIAADGATSIEAFRPATHPKVDCFYVYPTVSHSPGLSAEPFATESERRAVRQQVERLTSVCRLFAPVYRQATVTSMKPGFTPPPTPEQFDAAQRLAHADVAAAWGYYLAHDNRRRGVILIGHSQGAIILRDLIRRSIDARPAQWLLISAVLPGTFIRVPKGKDVGATFVAIPPCRSDTQTGCVIAFNTFRADHPMPADLVPHFPDQEEVCTNPAALSGGSGVLRPYLSATGQTIIPDFTAPQLPWTSPPVDIRTPFVTLPDLYSAECRQTGGWAYLAVSLTAQPGDRRTGALAGDWMIAGKPEPTSGLHLIDLDLVQGNLVDVLRRQAEAFERKERDRGRHEGSAAGQARQPAVRASVGPEHD
jgi:hypothetical protein